MPTRRMRGCRCSCNLPPLRGRSAARERRRVGVRAHTTTFAVYTVPHPASPARGGGEEGALYRGLYANTLWPPKLGWKATRAKPWRLSRAARLAREW